MLNAVKKLHKKLCKKGFTLLELLVVVLIIGILAGIALPQYNKAVTKARLAEVLVNVKAIEDSMNRYLLKNGFPSENIPFKDIADIELPGNEMSNNPIGHQIGDNKYFSRCTSGFCSIEVDIDDDYDAILELFINDRDDNSKACYTNDTDKGRFICKYLEPLGWEYYDEEW